MNSKGVYGVVFDIFDVQVKLKELENAYSEMPASLNCTGCGKCCQVQHPNCYYIEFINMMLYINKNWTDKQKDLLHYSCVEKYLDNSLEKACVFLNEDMSCNIYEVRDFNCRAFGIIPKKSYADRVKKRNKEFKKSSLKLQKQTDCCPDIAPEKPISQARLDVIFEKIYSLDRDIGVPKEDLLSSDNYLTFHDHFMLHTYIDKPEILQALTEVKQSSDENKKDFLKQFMVMLGVEKL